MASVTPGFTPLDKFIPNPQVRERFETTIRAPAALVMEVAENFDVQSLRIVRAIFCVREKLMRAPRSPVREPRGLRTEMQQLGWGVLEEQAGRLLVCGATCQPWLASVRFTSLPAQDFAAYAERDQVKIAWTLEAESLEASTTRFAHETRAVATDEEARERFDRYWRWARFGIITIRLHLLPAIRRTAEKRWQASSAEQGLQGTKGGS